MRVPMIRKAFRRRQEGAERGMTLLEIMVVITIIGVVMAVVGVAVLPQLDNARIDATKQAMTNIETALKLYYTRHGKYPDTGAGIGVLVQERLLEKTPKDGWGNDFVYLNEGGRPIIRSYGGDGVPGGDGKDADIDNASLERR